ncbi:hypothetical protein DL98DRAFT_525721 [Cadophora sp. DSE1049]|nr:hypothetical protein DL98DRAFT_525721 [Cadophora sp. DSE1049]
MAPNFSRKLGLEETKEPGQNRTCSRGQELGEIICCGVKIDFYEDCGHTLTLTDHHRSCIHYNKANVSHGERYGRLLNAQPHPPPTLSMFPKTGSHLPYPQPRCKDLHRYISLIPGKCDCQHPDSHEYLLRDSLLPDRSGRTALSESEVLRRRIYWLQQQSLDAETFASIRILEWSTKLRNHQQQEEGLEIPFPDRTFMYDPDCGANIFLAAVEVAFLRKEQRICVICKKKASNRYSRRLPCGCVFDVKCLKSWFLGRKGFRLVKKRTQCEAGYGKPVWEDSDYSGFV